MSCPTAKLQRLNPPELATPPGYAQVVKVRSGPMIFVAGQVASDASGKPVGGTDAETQADQVFANLNIALNAAGASIRDLVKLTVYLRDMRDLPKYRRARDRFLGTVTPSAMPAITLVEVSNLFASDYLIEVDAIAAGDAD